MNPVSKTLWFIESHFAAELTLEIIATNVDVSRFYLSRAFVAATGFSIMRYVRARRLTEAAKLLARDADDILSVAIESGYNSHEAFTRAFREQFAVTPETIRAQRHLNNINLLEAMRMDENKLVQLEPPRFINSKALLIAGLREHYECGTSIAGMPAQWQRFAPYIGNIRGQVGSVAYGVCFNMDDAGNTDYLCGVEVNDFSTLVSELSSIRIPERKYAVFFHREHISAIRNSWDSVWIKWVPHSGHEIADAPFFERYTETFDPQSGNGGVELWVPLK